MRATGRVPETQEAEPEGQEFLSVTAVKTILLYCVIKVILFDLEYKLVVYCLGSSFYCLRAHMCRICKLS